MYWLINKRPPLHNAKRTFPMITAAGVVCMAMLLTMCAPYQPVTHGTFSVDSLLRAQAVHLTSLHASLDKEVLFGNEREETTVVLKDTLAWQKELEVFSVMDAFNKPVNRNRYTVAESVDTKSNLRVRTFLTKEGLPIIYVRFYYRDTPTRLRKIESEHREMNGLFKTGRLLSMEFDEWNGIPVMTSYSVSGGQKMLMDDTVKYDIKGRVRFKN